MIILALWILAVPPHGAWFFVKLLDGAELDRGVDHRRPHLRYRGRLRGAVDSSRVPPRRCDGLPGHVDEELLRHVLRGAFIATGLGRPDLFHAAHRGLGS